MITEHEFNTRWWGAPVGVVTDKAFFEQPEEERRRLLQPYEWAEYRTSMPECAHPAEVQRAGFFWTDVQLRFRLALGRVPVPESATSLDLVFADEEPFSLTLEDLADFEHERYRYLRGATQEKINERYLIWANDIVREHPSWCTRVLHNGALQGWFLCMPAGQKLNLTLATLHRDASVSGLLLYAAALSGFARRGARVGYASFCVSNTLSLNIYAQLGARFATPELCWMWVAS